MALIVVRGLGMILAAFILSIVLDGQFVEVFDTWGRIQDWRQQRSQTASSEPILTLDNICLMGSNEGEDTAWGTVTSPSATTPAIS